MDNNKDNSFFLNLSSLLEVNTDYEKKEINYTWLERFEEVLPYLDNILRNPKRFIVNEEEIVKVELAKKITVESVIHLTQHTNLIQDYDQKTGDVKPSKILNINKDESLDTYENRFVYTLINNMRTFFEQRQANLAGHSYYKDAKDFNYQAVTNIDNEKIKVSVQIDSIDEDVTVNESKDGLTTEERLKKIKIQLDGFMGTELMQNLSKLHVSPVRSPIRKTNVILKNPNFQQAFQMWNFIQSYMSDDFKFDKEKEEYMDIGERKELFDRCFFQQYIAMGILNNEKKLTEKKAVSITVEQLVEQLLDIDLELDEDKIKKLFQVELKKVKEKNQLKEKQILKIYEDKMKDEARKVKEACSMLRG